MNHLIEKLWFFIAAICFVATLLTFGAALGENEVCEETSTEIVELGEFEALPETEKRRSRKSEHVGRFFDSILVATKDPRVTRSRIVCKYFVPLQERDFLNGHGGFLLV